jgi:hypothetical protein
MSQGMKEDPTLQLGTDKMELRYVHDKPFTVRLHDRSEW